MQAAPLICPALLLLPEQPLITQVITGCFSIQRLNSSLKSNERGRRLCASPQLRNEPSQEPNPHLMTGPRLARRWEPGWDSLRDHSGTVLAGAGCGTLGSKLGGCFPARGLCPHRSRSPLDIFDLGIVVCLASWRTRRRRAKLCLPRPDPNSRLILLQTLVCP